MTEQDYINTTALAHVRLAAGLLRALLPESTPGISGDQYRYRQAVDFLRECEEHLDRAVRESMDLAAEAGGHGDD